MNLDAPRPFVVLDGEVEIEKRTRSTIPIQYPLCGWSSREAISGLIAADCYGTYSAWGGILQQYAVCGEGHFK